MYLKEVETNTIIIEKSKFICYMKHIKTEDEYKDFLNIIKKKHYDATHVCSAFISNNIKRSSDDGEPSGTAGVPILSVLEKHNLNEMCALVVRYFGGVKLGAGGLVRAYSSAVSETLKNKTLYEDKAYPKYELKLSYELANKIERYLKNNVILLDTKYDTEITYYFALDDNNKINTISEYTKGILPTYISDVVVQTMVKWFYEIY